MRIVLAEDLLLLRQGLVHILHAEGHQVLAAVTDADALLAAVTEHDPDLAIIDVRLPPGFRDEGLRAALRLRHERPGRPVLILSQYVEAGYAADLLADGGAAMDPEVVAQLLHRNRRDGPLTTLSSREHHVLGLMAEGLSNTAIAERLVLATVSVEKHIGAIFTKLDLPHGHDDIHRRVMAVLAHLQVMGGGGSRGRRPH